MTQDSEPRTRTCGGVIETGDSMRLDHGKLRFDLIPADAMEELAKVYTVGCMKYGERAWEKGMKWGRCVAALERHMNAWKRGEDLDPVDGTHHLAAAAWNALALLAYSMRGVGEDNRGYKDKDAARKDRGEQYHQGP